MSGLLKLPVAFAFIIGKHEKALPDGNFPNIEKEKNKVELKFTPRCRSLQESIRQHVKLLVLTRYGEYRFDPGYGTSLWKEDFDTTINLQDWKSEAENSITEMIREHEQRLSDIYVDITITDTEFRSSERDTKRAKKKVSVTVEGRILQTDDRFKINETVYFNPVSLD